MTASYLTTDIIVIIVLFVVLVLVGIFAFFIHYYWTKIGVADIWNTVKWSSMRSSLYRTIGRFSRGSINQYPPERPLSGVSNYSDNVYDISYENKPTYPVTTSYITPPNRTLQKPVSIISYNNSVRNNYPTRISQPNEYTRNPNNQYYDLASMIQKQRF